MKYGTVALRRHQGRTNLSCQVSSQHLRSSDQGQFGLTGYLDDGTQSISHLKLHAAITDHTTHDLQDWGRRFPEDHLNKAKDATILKRFASLQVRRTTTSNIQSPHSINHPPQLHLWLLKAYTSAPLSYEDSWADHRRIGCCPTSYDSGHQHVDDGCECGHRLGVLTVIIGRHK